MLCPNWTGWRSGLACCSACQPSPCRFLLEEHCVCQRGGGVHPDSCARLFPLCPSVVCIVQGLTARERALIASLRSGHFEADAGALEDLDKMQELDGKLCLEHGTGLGTLSRLIAEDLLKLAAEQDFPVDSASMDV